MIRAKVGHFDIVQGRGLGAAAFVLAAAAALALAACPRAPLPGEQEEIPTAAEDVPAKIRAAGAGYCERIGAGQCTDWYWDVEDSCWEVKVVGLPRAAELDINPDGTFSELELVYTLAELEETLPEVARVVHQKARDDPHVFIELSLRRDSLLDDIPDLATAWTLSGVVLEFQLANGRDFELDARGMTIEKPVDDASDPSNR